MWQVTCSQVHRGLEAELFVGQHIIHVCYKPVAVAGQPANRRFNRFWPVVS